MARPKSVPKSGYVDWVVKNRTVIKTAVEKYMDVDVKRDVIEMLKMAAQYLAEQIDNDIRIPIYTGNLHDSTGIAVYTDGTMQGFTPTKLAVKKQSSGYRRDIDGHEFLQKSFNEGRQRFKDGVWIVLFSAVPYAAKIDAIGSPKGRGKYFFRMNQMKFQEMIISNLREIGDFNNPGSTISILG